MYPWHLEKLLQESASWMLSKNYKRIWWTPSVLTDKNPDDNPIFSLPDATMVFHALHSRDLLASKTKPVTDEDNNQRFIAVSVFNLDNINEWKTLSLKRSPVDLIIIPTIRYIFGKSKWLIPFFVFIASAFFGKLLSNLANDIYFCLKNIFH